MQCECRMKNDDGNLVRCKNEASYTDGKFVYCRRHHHRIREIYGRDIYPRHLEE